MALLGPTVMKHGPSIDEPIVRWTSSHQVRLWAAVMSAARQGRQYLDYLGRGRPRRSASR